MAGSAKLYLFGGFRLVGSSGRPAHVRARKGKALIAYLACAPGCASTREKLATLLWSDSDGSHARESLRRALSDLRCDLGDRDGALLQCQGESLALRTDRLWVDILEFDREHAGSSHARLERAAKRFTGDLLDGLVNDAPLFEEWLTMERVRTRERAIACLRTVLARHVGARAFDRAIATANRILEIDPCLEDVHRTLMEIYLATSMRASAVRQYERCRTALRRELAVEPDQATTANYHRCLGPAPRTWKS
jgi:DNA-binding SARP family transcriptional activator